MQKESTSAQQHSNGSVENGWRSPEDVRVHLLAFKPNSVTARAVLDQRLQTDKADLHVPCLKEIRCLSRSFLAKVTKAVIELLVHRLMHLDFKVAAGMVLELQKLSHTDNLLHLEHSRCIKLSHTDNLLHLEHSKTIVDENAVLHLVHLVAIKDEDVQVPALILLSNFARMWETIMPFRLPKLPKHCLW
ncbi:hypothetical protein L7F22_064037 [Adiantum nelumboides]|nr:hypothetical protein [Adiantum nelumboides]